MYDAINFVTSHRSARKPVLGIIDQLEADKAVDKTFAGLVRKFEQERVCRQNAAISKVLHTDVWTLLSPDDVRAALAQAVTILSHPDYFKYLNDEGRAHLVTLLHAQEYWRHHNSALGKKDLMEVLKPMLLRVPTIARPNTDLFVDVLETIPPDVLSAMGKPHVIKEGEATRKVLRFELQLTENCPNNCEHCAFGTSPGEVKSMPYPLAVKLIQALSARYPTARFFMYMDTDPLAYEDAPSGANFRDIARHAPGKMSGFITHGVHVFKGTGDDLRGLFHDNVLSGMSVHAFDAAMVRYVQDKLRGSLTPETEVQRRAGLRAAYRSRFLPLMEAIVTGSADVEIRVYRMFDQAGIVREVIEKETAAHKCAPEALNLLTEIENVQKELWEGLRKEAIARWGDVESKRFKPWDESVRDLFWLGKAARFLNTRCRLSEYAIRNIQDHMTRERRKEPMVMGDSFVAQVRYDGTVQLLTNELGGNRFRLAGDLAPSAEALAFAYVAAFLKALAMGDQTTPRIEMTVRDIPALLRTTIMQSNTALQFGYRAQLEQGFSHPAGQGYKMRMTTATTPDFTPQFKALYLNGLLEELRALDIEDPAALRHLYERVKQVPLPVNLEFQFVDPNVLPKNIVFIILILVRSQVRKT